ncbi:hypothetical protein DEU56DRAFT_753385 [Suillus clintonianus]|uniref:uncharacterized protein n=1 Tax=Suillus clintonianus TaxID=1904413 RepID=UPI001B8788B1|nr:uncharacterized protein DEU56DRAFT_753385 [Suillus clintonianus]KAG2147528.1 hypothetical protein DEU56DRAFT_753385 [Suillus clintonianus]
MVLIANTDQQSKREAESELSQVKEKLRNAYDHISYLSDRVGMYRHRWLTEYYRAENLELHMPEGVNIPDLDQIREVKVQKRESIFELGGVSVARKTWDAAGGGHIECHGAVDDAGKHAERARLHAFSDEALLEFAKWCYVQDRSSLRYIRFEEAGVNDMLHARPYLKPGMNHNNLTKVKQCPYNYDWADSAGLPPSMTRIFLAH